MINKKGGTLHISYSIVLVSCFILAIILFANEFAVDNNAAVSLSGDTNIQSNVNRLNASLEVYQSSNNITVTGLYGSSIEPGSDTLSRVATFSSGAEDTLPDVTDSFGTAILAVFGNNNNILIMAGGFVGLLGLAVGLYAWKTLKAGQPE